MLADQNYCEWIIGQPGIMTMLQSKYPELFNVITVGAPQTDDTPAHNKMQAMFLKREFQYAFINVLLGKSVFEIADEVAKRSIKARDAKVPNVQRILEDQIKTARELVQKANEPAECEWIKKQLPQREKELTWLLELQQRVQSFANAEISAIEPEIALQFECGYDVLFTASWLNKCLEYCEVHHPNTPDVLIEDTSFHNLGYRGEGKRIELKPQMGDDFPSVLRQMKRNRADTLVIGEFNAIGCTLDQVRAIFGDKRIITLEQIDNAAKGL
jgi:hypothetical protein